MRGHQVEVFRGHQVLFDAVHYQREVTLTISDTKTPTDMLRFLRNERASNSVDTAAHGPRPGFASWWRAESPAQPVHR